MKELEKAVRRGLELWLGGGATAGPPPPFSARALRRIGVMRLDRRLGNQVMLFSMVDALYESLPAAQIEVIAPPPYDVVWHGRPSVSQVVTFDRSRPFSPGGLARFLALRGRYDLVIEAGHHHRFSTSGAMLTRLLGAPLRLGFERGGSGSYLNLPVPVPEPLPPGRAELYASLARRLDPAASYRPPRWHFLPGEREAAAARWQAGGWPERCVGIHPGGRGVRRWDIEKFAQVASGVAAMGWHPLVFLGPAEAEEAPFWSSAGSPWSVVPAPPLRELAALMERLSLWISCDTGPLHIARALPIPALCVVVHPEGLEALEPAIDYRVVARMGEGPSAAEVLAAARELLAPAGSAR